uniref:IGFBP N-terminal domain-containing protein n=1 Tax=Setaria digitata TaxID=48799 RepID=A0A915Q296_9BILA
MNIIRFYPFQYFIIYIIHLILIIYSCAFLFQQQKQHVFALTNNATTEDSNLNNLFIIDSLSALCPDKCPSFCINPETLACSELANDPCECCVVCLHDVGELCGPAIGACRYPNFCQTKTDQNGIGICAGKFQKLNK